MISSTGATDTSPVNTPRTSLLSSSQGSRHKSSSTNDYAGSKDSPWSAGSPFSPGDQNMPHDAEDAGHMISDQLPREAFRFPHSQIDPGPSSGPSNPARPPSHLVISDDFMERLRYQRHLLSHLPPLERDDKGKRPASDG